MSFGNSQLLARHFQFTYRVIQMQTAGLSHADSLLQPPFRGNCLNWVLGHILVSRSDLLGMLGRERVWGLETCRFYERGSEPITGAGSALPLEHLLKDLDATQEALIAALEDPGIDMLLQQTVQSGERASTIGEQAAFLCFHEIYHTGQLELLRQLSGVNDKVI